LWKSCASTQKNPEKSHILAVCTFQQQEIKQLKINDLSGITRLLASFASKMTLNIYLVVYSCGK
jgi:hypothetical protein